jgi:hypothetical protein
MKIYIQLNDDNKHIDFLQCLQKEDYLKIFNSTNEIMTLDITDEVEDNSYNIVVSKSTEHLTIPYKEYEIMDLITLKEDEFLYLNYHKLDSYELKYKNVDINCLIKIKYYDTFADGPLFCHMDVFITEHNMVYHLASCFIYDDRGEPINEIVINDKLDKKYEIIMYELMGYFQRGNYDYSIVKDEIEMYHFGSHETYTSSKYETKIKYLNEFHNHNYTLKFMEPRPCL